MKSWHWFIFLGGILALWSLNKGFLMTRTLVLATEMFVFSLFLMGYGLFLREQERRENGVFEDILDEDRQNQSDE